MNGFVLVIAVVACMGITVTLASHNPSAFREVKAFINGGIYY